MEKLSIDFIKKALNNEGYILLSEIYISAHTPLLMKCPKGHEIKLPWQKWKIGRRCKYCNKSIHIDDIKKEFDKAGYTLLSKEYISSKHKLNYICDKNHNGSISWSHWKNGSRCKRCYVDKILTPFYKIKKEIESDGYFVLSDEQYYINNKKIIVMCKNKHKEYNTTVNKWRSGNRCVVCSYEKKSVDNRLPYNYVKDSFNVNGYDLISKNYTNALSPIEFVCPNGHTNTIKWRDWKEGCRCSQCSFSFSKGEIDLSNFIESLGFNVLRNDRKIIKPYELDIVIPEKKIAIEYCGLYWHSELAGKDRNYHLNKLDKCIENGYRLITIFEDEWLYKNDIVKSKISYLLKKFIGNHKVHARQCEIKSINNKDKLDFLNNNHLQGNDIGSIISIGSFFNKHLVGVMTFTKPSISKGYKNKYENLIELNRFCVHRDYTIPGLFSKMFSYFNNNFEHGDVFSYADLRWYTGDSYIKFGFNLVKRTKPNYWYVKNNKRIHRFNLRKPIGCKETEDILRKTEGYYKIWDCGSLKFKI